MRQEGRLFLDFEVQRCSRRCTATQRELKPGDTFYSMLIPQGADIIRQDFAEHAWPGAPENALGWWKSVVPDPQARRVEWAPNDVILQFFTELMGRPAAPADLRYVLALLMIRRKILRWEETETGSESEPAQLVLYCPKHETEYRVAVAEPARERVAEIQGQLAELLFSTVV